MYPFSVELRELLEKQKMALAVYQLLDEKVVTVLVSDGFCQLRQDTREHLVSALDHSMFERVDELDAVLLVRNDEKIWKDRMIAVAVAAQKRDLDFFVVGLSVREHDEVPLVFFLADAQLSAMALLVFLIFLSWLSLVLAGLSFFGGHQGYDLSDIVDVCI